MEIVKNPKLTEKEKLLSEYLQSIHKCTWWLRLFKHPVTFHYEQSNNSGIGTTTHLVCNKCGKRYDITDYSI